MADIDPTELFPNDRTLDAVKAGEMTQIHRGNRYAYPLEAAVPDSSNGSFGPTQFTGVTVENRATVNGTLEDANGNRLADDWLGFFSLEGFDYRTNTTSTNGRYAVALNKSETYGVEYHQDNRSDPNDTAYPKDGRVDVYAFDSVSYAGDTTHNRTLPKGYTLNVSVVDPAGNPIAGAPVWVSHENGSVRASVSMESDTNGMARAPDSNGTGIEVSTVRGGEIDTNVEPPNAQWTRNTSINDFQVLGDRTEEIVLYPAAVVTGTVRYADGRFPVGASQP
jgi:hypothetical protein